MSVDLFLGMGGDTPYGVETPRADVSTCGVARERLAPLTALRRCGNRLYNWGRDRGVGYAYGVRGDAAGGRLDWLPWVSWVRVEGGDGVDMWREKLSPGALVASRGSFKWRLPTLPRCWRSTIGAGGLNFSVRDGKRWGPAAIAA